jgi:hypothetical protein
VDAQGKNVSPDDEISLKLSFGVFFVFAMKTIFEEMATPFLRGAGLYLTRISHGNRWLD